MAPPGLDSRREGAVDQHRARLFVRAAAERRSLWGRRRAAGGAAGGDGDVLFYESDLPDCELPRSREDANCAVGEDGEGKVRAQGRRGASARARPRDAAVVVVRDEERARLTLYFYPPTNGENLLRLQVPSRHAPPKIIWGLAAEPPNLRGVYRPGSLTSHNPKSVWTLPPYCDLANWSSTP